MTCHKHPKPKKPPFPIRTWHVYHVNCDCGSFNHAWMRPAPTGRFRRCPHCRKPIDLLELSDYRQVKARTEYEALTALHIPTCPRLPNQT